MQGKVILTTAFMTTLVIHLAYGNSTTDSTSVNISSSASSSASNLNISTTFFPDEGCYSGNFTLEKINPLLTKAHTSILLVFLAVLCLIPVVLHFIRRSPPGHWGDVDDLHTARGGVSTSLVAMAAAGQMYTPLHTGRSASYMLQHGISGAFWSSVGAAVSLMVFPSLTNLVTTRAPGAKTFLQIMDVRFGRSIHLMFCVISLAVHFISMTTLLSLVAEMLQELVSPPVPAEFSILALVTVSGLAPLVGGVTSTLVVKLVCLMLVAAIVFLVFLVFTATNSLPGIYDIIFDCPSLDNENFFNFQTKDLYWSVGLRELVLSLTYTFCSQSIWQCRFTSRPKTGAQGVTLGVLTWFTGPFLLATTTGLVAARRRAEELTLSDHLVDRGSVPAVALHQGGWLGDVALLLLLAAGVVASLTGDVMAVSTLMVVDVYQRYLVPYRIEQKVGCCSFCGKNLEIKRTEGVQMDESNAAVPGSPIGYSSNNNMLTDTKKAETVTGVSSAFSVSDMEQKFALMKYLFGGTLRLKKMAKSNSADLSIVGSIHSSEVDPTERFDSLKPSSKQNIIENKETKKKLQVLLKKKLSKLTSLKEGTENALATSGQQSSKQQLSSKEKLADSPLSTSKQQTDKKSQNSNASNLQDKEKAESTSSKGGSVYVGGEMLSSQADVANNKQDGGATTANSPAPPPPVPAASEPPEYCACPAVTSCELCEVDLDTPQDGRWGRSLEHRAFYRCPHHGEVRDYQRHLCRVTRHLTAGVSLMTVFLSLLTHACGWQLSLWLRHFSLLVTSPAVPGLVIAVNLAQATSKGIVSGYISGVVSGIVFNFVLAFSEYYEPVSSFLESTSSPGPLTAGVLLGLAVSALVNAAYSGLTSLVKSVEDENETWGPLQEIDNPLQPWASRYPSLPRPADSTKPLREDVYDEEFGHSCLTRWAGPLTLGLMLGAVPGLWSWSQVMSYEHFVSYYVTMSLVSLIFLFAILGRAAFQLWNHGLKASESSSQF